MIAWSMISFVQTQQKKMAVYFWCKCWPWDAEQIFGLLFCAEYFNWIVAYKAKKNIYQPAFIYWRFTGFYYFFAQPDLAIPLSFSGSVPYEGVTKNTITICKPGKLSD